MGSVAKSYMRKGFLIYEEMLIYLTILYLRRPLVMLPIPFDFLIYEGIFFVYKWSR
jgi:hypothetical protein